MIDCKISVAALSIMLWAAPVVAGEVDYPDIVAPYLERNEGVTSDAGDARNINAAAQIIDPWPRYSRNRRIPGDGQRMSGAVERYRDVSKLPLAPPPISPTPIGTSGFSASSGAGPTPQAATTATTTSGQ